VIYYYLDQRGTIYFIMAYAKNVKENLTEAEKKALREIARQLKEES
jgi:hypothetical protein